MKTSKTIGQLAQEIERQSEEKRDFTAPTTMIGITPEGKLRVGPDIEPFNVTPHCHSQIASRLKIPKQYYDRMLKDSPDLLANNVNHWFTNNPENRMIRTLDGTARAFLSDSYRALDNIDLLKTALPIIAEKDCEIVSCEVTENRMYLKILFPKLRAEVKKGDVIQAGLVLSNSEVGNGALKSEILLYRLICLNGMIGSNSLNKYHVGKRGGSDRDSIEEVLSNRTKELGDTAFWAEVRDVIKASFDEAHFMNDVQKLRDATEGVTIQAKAIPQAIEVVKNNFQLNDAQGEDIFRHLIEGGDFSKYGLANAITRTATDQEDYDSATGLERLGGKVIELPKKDWEAIAIAA